MVRKPKRIKNSLHRKGGRRRKKRVRPSSSAASLRQASKWPLHEVMLSRDWDEEGAIIEILVARRSPLGQIAVGAFLVDLGCLGVKNALAHVFDSQRDYEQSLRSQIMAHQPMGAADLNLVAKIIREGVNYASQLGFEPEPDCHKAMLLLSEADPEACSVHVPLGGPEGKPFFVAGPYDNVPTIIAKLTRAVGEDGFHYIVPVDPDTEVFIEEPEE